ncbi:MAG: alanine dehydrogenase [Nitrospirae bacterium]|nr:alanine dehydrogenase [Nitrospirota bacterium]MBI5695402.1 alanine dehydrogenase [Nitrospirota bacterium]
MIIGVPKEIKDKEFRVGMTPAGAAELVHAGHTVLVEAGAGEGSGIPDREYIRAGAKVAQSRESLFRRAELIVKVKEPRPEEYELLREGQIIFTYLHLAADRGLTLELLDRKVVAVAYETIQRADGSLPLLMPMSQVAGRLSVQVGAYYLQENNGGRGVLLSGVPGVEPARVVVIGAGTVGANAAKIAHGMGAEVTLLDLNVDRLDYIEDIFHGSIRTLVSNRRVVEEAVTSADLVIGAVLVPGAKAPKLITREMVSRMRRGSVVVDVAIDQGGCFETSRPTSHSDPVYMVDGVIHYCVTNMPGAVPRTSTFGLTNVTLPYVMKIADNGVEAALSSDPAFMKGLNCWRGRLVNRPVAEAFGLSCEDAVF